MFVTSPITRIWVPVKKTASFPLQYNKDYCCFVNQHSDTKLRTAPEWQWEQILMEESKRELQWSKNKTSLPQSSHKTPVSTLLCILKSPHKVHPITNMFPHAYHKYHFTTEHFFSVENWLYNQRFTSAAERCLTRPSFWYAKRHYFLLDSGFFLFTNVIYFISTHTKCPLAVYITIQSNHSKTLRFKSPLVEKQLLRYGSPTQILFAQQNIDFFIIIYIRDVLIKAQSHDRLWVVLIMILGRALRLFLQDPKSQAYLLIWRNHCWVRSLSEARKTKASRRMSRISKVSSQSVSADTTQFARQIGSRNTVNFPLLLSLMSTSTLSSTVSKVSRLPSVTVSALRTVRTMSKLWTFWNLRDLLPFLSHWPSAGCANWSGPSMMKRVLSRVQPTVFIDSSLISMLMTSRFLRLSRRKERKDHVAVPSCLVFMLMCSRWDSTRLLASFKRE